MGKYTYPELYNRLNCEVLVIVFHKANGSLRVMLATRNTHTLGILGENLSYELNGIDHRCSINNGNVGVIDLEICESRSFKADRVIAVYSCRVINTVDEYNTAMENFKRFKAEYESALYG